MREGVDKSLVVIQKLKDAEVLEDYTGKLHLVAEFELFFKGHLSRMLRKEHTPDLVEKYVLDAIVDSLVDCGFFASGRTEEEAHLAVQIIRTFLSDDEIRRLIEIFGV